MTQIPFTAARGGRCEPGPLRPSRSGVRLTLLFPPRDHPPGSRYSLPGIESATVRITISLPSSARCRTPLHLRSVSRMPSSPADLFLKRTIYIRSSARGGWTKSSSTRFTVNNHVSSHLSPPTCTLHLSHRHRHRGSRQEPSNGRSRLWCLPRLLLQRIFPHPLLPTHTNTTFRRATTPTSSQTSASPRPRSGNFASALLRRR